MLEKVLNAANAVLPIARISCNLTAGALVGRKAAQFAGAIGSESIGKIADMVGYKQTAEDYKAASIRLYASAQKHLARDLTIAVSLAVAGYGLEHAENAVALTLANMKADNTNFTESCHETAENVFSAAKSAATSAYRAFYGDERSNLERFKDSIPEKMEFVKNNFRFTTPPSIKVPYPIASAVLNRIIYHAKPIAEDITYILTKIAPVVIKGTAKIGEGIPYAVNHLAKAYKKAIKLDNQFHDFVNNSINQTYHTAANCLNQAGEFIFNVGNQTYHAGAYVVDQVAYGTTEAYKNAAYAAGKVVNGSTRVYKKAIKLDNQFHDFINYRVNQAKDTILHVNHEASGYILNGTIYCTNQTYQGLASLATQAKKIGVVVKDKAVANSGIAVATTATVSIGALSVLAFKFGRSIAPTGMNNNWLSEYDLPLLPVEN